MSIKHETLSIEMLEFLKFSGFIFDKNSFKIKSTPQNFEKLKKIEEELFITLFSRKSSSKNRMNLLEKFKQLKHCGILIFGGEKKYQYSTDKLLKFRQESNFLYLTGNLNPNCCCFIDTETKKYIMFIEETENDSLWDGEFPTKEEYKNIINCDKILNIKDLPKYLNQNKIQNLLILEKDEEKIKGKLKNIKINKEILQKTMTKLRMIKSPDEIRLMKIVNKISSQAHIEIIKSVKPNTNESFYEGVFTSYCIQQGCTFLAYPCTNGGGSRSAILHYNRNKEVIKNGELLLSDCGAELNGYSSDITRTIPINGKFTKSQREIYEIVLKIQKLCIDQMKPGIVYLDLYFLALDVIAREFLKLKILKGKFKDIIENGIPELFMAHGLGHFIGLDVHDAPTIDYDIRLKVGMVITVEPGIYFMRKSLEAAFEDPRQKRFFNIEKCKEYFDFGGIRIEDNILIVKNGIENLTHVPKEIKDLEELMNQKNH
eukprot:gene1544-12670_t